MSFDLRTGTDTSPRVVNDGGMSQPGLPKAAAPKKVGRDPTADERQAAAQQANLNDTKAVWDPSSETYMFVPLNSGEQISRNQDKETHPEWFTTDGSTPPADNTAPVINNDTLKDALDGMSEPVTNPALTTRGATTQRAAFGDNQFSGAPTKGEVSTPARQNPATIVGLTGTTTTAQDVAKAYGDQGQAPGQEAPDVDRTKIDTILNGLSGYQNKIADLAEDNTGLSVAEAQLKKATDLANLQAGIDTEASQRAALGQARSSRSRADRGLLERQAVGESAFIGQEAARTASMRRAENEGNLSELRAQEADYDRRFRLEALGKAADLGLNRSALEVDISKTNLDSATNWINQQFGQLGIDKQINQEQAQSLLGFTRDMAAIQLQYDQLSSQEQQQADALLMQKYGIDQQTMVALKGIKQQGKFHWDQVLAGITGGIGTAATAGISKAAGIT